MAAYLSNDRRLISAGTLQLSSFSPTDSADENKGMPLTGEADEIATDPQRAPAYMAQAVLQFNEHLERIGEIAIVILVGAMLSAQFLSFKALWFVLLLLLVVRPISVWLGLLGSSTVYYSTEFDRLVWHTRDRIGLLPGLCH